MSAQSVALTVDETALLGDCERTIERGFSTFLDVGSALAKIRDGQLYRASHETFASYCLERWKITARRAYQIMDAAGAVASLPEDVKRGSQISAKAAEQLSKVPEEKRESVVRRAAQKGRVTARSVKSAAATEEPADKSSAGCELLAELYALKRAVERRIAEAELEGGVTGEAAMEFCAALSEWLRTWKKLETE